MAHMEVRLIHNFRLLKTLHIPILALSLGKAITTAPRLLGPGENLRHRGLLILFQLEACRTKLATYTHIFRLPKILHMLNLAACDGIGLPTLLVVGPGENFRHRDLFLCTQHTNDNNQQKSQVTN
jgi:hypothetical protein